MDKKSDKRGVSGARREFLLAGTVGATALAGSSMSMAQNPKASSKPNHHDVIVIGGGFAGVAAARDASWRGRNTLLLEARSRLGGRTFTSSFGGHDDVEMGGAWLGWSQPHVWSEITRYQMPIKESASSAATKAVWMDGGTRVLGEMSEYGGHFESAVGKFFAPAREAFPRPFDPLFSQSLAHLDKVSAAEAIAALKLTPLERTLVTSFAAINGHSSPDRSSYLDQLRWFGLGDFDLANLWDNLGRYKIAGGTKRLIDAMSADSRSDVKLNSPVTSVVQGRDVVTVTTRRGEVHTAQAVVVAVPLNCLADIDFSPALSKGKMTVSQNRHTGSGTKLYARIKKGQPIVMGHGSADMPLCFLWTEYDDPDSQIMVGFGASPDLLDVNDDDAVAAAVQQYLPDAQLTESFGYDWNLDPYAKGTWCMYPPGVLTHHLKELQRPEGRVFFAGSDIANGWRGFIDGAVESGLQVSAAVDQALAGSQWEA
ncbi:MAG: flavin monoamine oxidase family protein [Lysobacterales bacterium]